MENTAPKSQPETVMRFGRVVFASIFGMFLLAIMIQQASVHLEMQAPGEFALPVPGMVILLGMVGLGWIWARASGKSLLTRPELICVIYSMLIASPLMTQGFWHRFVSITSTIPRSGDFNKMDAFGDRFWPHGANLLDEALKPGNSNISGDVVWETLNVEPGRSETVAVLQNAEADTISRLQIVIPVGPGGAVPGAPHLISILARPSELATDAHYFGRVMADGSDRTTEIFFSRVPAAVTRLHPGGFVRVGLYGVPLPSEAKEFVTVEFGLSGLGRVEFFNPKMLNVSAMENAFSGVVEVTETQYAGLSSEERVGTIVRPDNLWSFRGAAYYLSGFVPWRDWVGPLVAWGGWILLLLTGTFCLNVIFRKKWMETERYSLPLTRIPLALIGAEGGNLWKNRVFWAGFMVSLFWCLMKGWNFYNPAVPNLNIEVELASYFGAGWGGMWDGVTFQVLALLVGVAVFIELNILLSIVAGFFLFRSLYWIGEVLSWNVYSGYPFAQDQQVVAFLSYAVLTMVFSWKYLFQIVLTAIRPSGREREAGEVMSYRTAFLALGGIVVGSLAWAAWVGVSLQGILCFLIFLLLVGLVSSKIRAEAGLPYGYFTPNNSALVLLLLGGIGTFGPQMLLFAFMSSFFMSVATFFLIPGAQMEMIELGRQHKMKRRFVFSTVYLGILGGILIGGWVFLSNAYSLGGDSARYAWAFSDKSWYFNDFDRLISQASEELSGVSAGGDAAPAINPAIWAYVFGGFGTLILMVLRQLFAGFWFHPLGFVLGSSHMLNFLWGSFLVAWILRWTVVSLGGAEAVRTKLQPFFVGVFVAAVCSMLWWGIYGTYLSAQGAKLIYGAAP